MQKGHPGGLSAFLIELNYHSVNATVYLPEQAYLDLCYPIGDVNFRYSRAPTWAKIMR